MSLRSPMGRVLGTGSAKDGTGQWWAARVSAVALLPLTLWFSFSLLNLPALDYQSVHPWLAQPRNGFLSMLLVGVMSYHSYLGTTEVIQDYVHGKGMKLFLLLLQGLLYVLFGGAGLFAILRVAFGP